MHVVSSEPQSWFLLRDGDDLFLDLRVSSGVVEWSALIRLSPDEKAQYAASGHAYMVTLADSLHTYSQQHSDRDENATHGNRSYAAIMAWIAANPDAPR